MFKTTHITLVYGLEKCACSNMHARTYSCVDTHSTVYTWSNLQKLKSIFFLPRFFTTQVCSPIFSWLPWIHTFCLCREVVARVLNSSSSPCCRQWVWCQCQDLQHFIDFVSLISVVNRLQFTHLLLGELSYPSLQSNRYLCHTNQSVLYQSECIDTYFVSGDRKLWSRRPL